MKATAIRGHAPLLDLLEQARPYAERLVFGEGLRCTLTHGLDTITVGPDEVRTTWRESLFDAERLSELHETIEAAKLDDELWRMQDL